MATSLEHMTADEVGEWLKEHGFQKTLLTLLKVSDRLLCSKDA